MQNQKNEMKTAVSRPIRFRAWDKKNLKWLKIEEWSSAYASASISNDRIVPELSLDNNDFCGWSQFTGLLDKNGKEIYEGDIVRSSHWRQPLWKEFVGEVKYVRGLVGIYNSDNEGDMLSEAMWNGGFEIIGNIHENPELLTNN